MSDHLPECLNDDATYGLRGLCICDELRACEQRVAAMRKDSGELWLDGYGTGYQAGQTYALDAAQEAVAALDIGRDVRFSVDVQADALAAIDALREKP